MPTADCVIAFSFGNRCADHAIMPGPVNLALAQYLADYAVGMPIIAQWEVATALGALLPTTEDVVSIDRNIRRPGRYLATHNVAESAWHYMSSHGWKSAVVVAHQDHMARAVASSHKAGVEVIDLAAPLPAFYDPQSGQRWTRSRSLFKFHELLANPVYRALGYC